MSLKIDSITPISIPFISLEFPAKSRTSFSSFKPLSRSTSSLNNLSLRRTFVPKNQLSQSTPSDFLTQSKIGLITKSPELCEEGTGGTYFLKNQHNVPVAVFKPSNEEPLCHQNPKRTSAADFHFKGFIPGEGSQREIFAHQIDNHFAGVPETHAAEITHWIFTDKAGTPGTAKPSNLKTKSGSIQQFVPDIQCSVDDMGYGKFSLQDVQRIAVLDMLLVNCDRNGGNILVRKNSHKLVPIDHAFCLPDYRYLSDLQWFEWLTWRQVKQPTSSEIIAFIDKFDIAAAVTQAKELGIRQECILTLRLSHMFLKHALKTQLTLCEIAKLMVTRGDQASLFAELVAKASYSGGNIVAKFSALLSRNFR